MAAEFLSEAFAETKGGCLIEVGVGLNETVGFGEILFGEALHADEETAALAVLPGPGFDLLVKLPPAPKVEIANAEVSTDGVGHGGLERGEELLIDVVEDTGQIQVSLLHRLGRNHGFHHKGWRGTRYLVLGCRRQNRLMAVILLKSWSANSHRTGWPGGLAGGDVLRGDFTATLFFVTTMESSDPNFRRNLPRRCGADQHGNCRIGDQASSDR